MSQSRRLVFTCAVLAAQPSCSWVSYVLSIESTGSGSGVFVTDSADLRCRAPSDLSEHVACEISYLPKEDPGPAPTVTLRALASDDSRFLGWTGVCLGTDPCTVTIDDSKKLSAEFVRVDYGTSMRADRLGNSIVTGTFYATKTIGNTLLSSVGDVDVFVVKYGVGSSVPVWISQLGGVGIEWPQSLEVDVSGDILLQLTVKGSVSVSGSSYSCTDPHQMLIVKLAGADGAVLWSRCLIQ